ncbi:MAG: ABC transporter ATP-binding protein [Nostoc sp. DedQUE08]|uniref:ABC transporter ATP-binding protein n=1 Tax=unclassified Nostoc TaxID=2593658 RepID=UPI002AD49091|nr:MULTISPECIES: ABC transporter ATP-binding protein [unclassified Nostoc]MDZ8035396.1 ABC transporter ATP-binding protein [Nostoc sp. DedSLP04]MDZ8065132.1 ABC transporter ATP-binding protein [Nostoc sp. DedQUE08]MDZ8134826.1 ABC transporter ATP-binding protein [Nostoc sp. DedQUE04]
MFLQVNKLNKHFSTQSGTLVVLKDINMAIEQGEFICAVGASGSGKSTLLRQIAGLDSPTSGEVRIDGKQIAGPGPDRGMVFQNYTLYPWMNVQENTEFGLKLQGVPKKERREQASYFLSIVGLSRFSGSLPKELSGGMKQRVAIARALASEPKVLLMDEPFGALDIHTKESMHEFILDLWQRTNITIFMITHDVEEAVFLSNRIYALGACPGTVRKVMTINLPERSPTIKRHSTFHDYRDELMDLLRQHGKEAVAA